MDDFFDRLRAETLKIYLMDHDLNEEELKAIKKHDNCYDVQEAFNKINWDSKQFYIELALSKIYLDKL